jgi:hypothetical protein
MGFTAPLILQPIAQKSQDWYFIKIKVNYIKQFFIFNFNRWCTKSGSVAKTSTKYVNL